MQSQSLFWPSNNCWEWRVDGKGEGVKLWCLMSFSLSTSKGLFWNFSWYGKNITLLFPPFLSFPVISQKDEHCWVGELNGLRGWFPAKFVELLDERSKFYTSAGDDTVTGKLRQRLRQNSSGCTWLFILTSSPISILPHIDILLHSTWKIVKDFPWMILASMLQIRSNF